MANVRRYLDVRTAESGTDCMGCEPEDSDVEHGTPATVYVAAGAPDFAVAYLYLCDDCRTILAKRVAPLGEG